MECILDTETENKKKMLLQLQCSKLLLSFKLFIYIADLAFFLID